MMNMTIFYDIDDLSIMMIYDVLPDFNALPRYFRSQYEYKKTWGLSQRPDRSFCIKP